MSSHIYEHGLWTETPLQESKALSKIAGCRVLLKLEYLQPSGSFKSRGIGNYLLNHLPSPRNSSASSTASSPSATTLDFSTDAPPAHFYCSSGGNAGLACVTAAVALNCPCTVVVPLTTSSLMIEKLKAAGAHDVIQTGATWADADRYLKEVCLKEDATGVYVPPFDHPDVWAGNSTIVPELVDQLGSKSQIYGLNEVIPKAIVCSVGGGGLLCGIKQGLEKAPTAWSDVNVLAVETYGAESLYSAVEADGLVTLPGITSKATSLGCVRVAEQSFKYARRAEGVSNPVKCLRVTDDQAAAACVAIADYERAVVELACGASVAPLFHKNAMESALGQELNSEDVVVVVLCGGSNVTIEMLAAWREAARSSRV